jgi:ribosomal protein L11 methyltransferase
MSSIETADCCSFGFKLFIVVCSTNFHPIEVWDKSKETLLVYLRAEFHPANINANYDIIITPKMSFGTGHHATTYLMMEKMLQLNFENKNVIDFGTGTGVLSILAEKLGANNILAIDNDDWSIQNALLNIEANQSKNISVQKAEECFCREVKSTILLANINLNVIKDNILKIKESSISGGEVLFSGILDENFNEMRILLNENKFSNLEPISKDGWLLIYALNN